MMRYKNNPFGKKGEEEEEEYMEQENIYSDVEEKIIRERNLEIRQIERDIEDLAEIQKDLSFYVFEQGEQINLCAENVNIVEKNTEEALSNLEKAEEHVNRGRQLLRDIVIVSSSAGLGSLGFLGGPFIGIGTLLVTTLAGSGVVFVMRSSMSQ